LKYYIGNIDTFLEVTEARAYLDSRVKSTTKIVMMLLFKKTSISTERAAFMAGVGSIINITGRRFRPLSFGDQSSDVKALQSDWKVVGSDIRKAMNTIAKDAENQKPTKHV